MDQVRARPPGQIEALPEVRPITTFTYEPAERRDPFALDQRLEEIAERPPPSGPTPDPTRAKEELERYTLDSLRMVGTLERDAGRWALIMTRDRILHRVAVGNYLGQNHGLITRISADEIQLTEIIPDGQGGWRDRQAAIALAR